MENPKEALSLDSIIEKIRQMIESSHDPGMMSRLERDLLLQYLRDAYELVLGIPKKKESLDPVEQGGSETKDVAAGEEEVAALATETALVHEAPGEDEKQRSTSSLRQGISVLEKFQQEEKADTKGQELIRTSSRNKPLKELITLNDKFMFIRDFFGNSISTYESAIEEIDQLPSKNAVLDYMQEKCWTEAMMEQDRELIDRFISLADAKFTD